jgi:hypothetical protein
MGKILDPPVEEIKEYVVKQLIWGTYLLKSLASPIAMIFL